MIATFATSHNPWPKSLWHVQILEKFGWSWSTQTNRSARFFSFSADLIGVSKIGHQVMKLGVNSQDLQDFIMIRLDVMKNMISSEAVVGKANPKLGWNSCYTWGNQFGSFWLFISSPVLTKLGQLAPSLEYFVDNCNTSHVSPLTKWLI